MSLHAITYAVYVELARTWTLGLGPAQGGWLFQSLASGHVMDMCFHQYINGAYAAADPDGPVGLPGGGRF